jgi:hypothetical protein
MEIPAGMKLRFTFENEGDQPLYLNIEPVPDRYLLRPGEKVQFYSEPSADDHPPVITKLSDDITIWPNTTGNDLTLIDGENAETRSWVD